MSYVLLTFYNRGTVESPIWEVYGWENSYTNTCLESFKTKSQAVEYCHTFYEIPVLLTSKGGTIAEKLTPQPRENKDEV